MAKKKIDKKQVAGVIADTAVAICKALKDQKGAGRPNEYKSKDNTAVGHQVSLTPNEKANIVKQYGSLTKALKTLLKAE